MEAKLLVVGGKASRGSISLKLPTVIGRSREVTLTIAHPMVSRRHCEVYEAEGLLMIRDLGSLNGTVICGQRVKEAPLPPDGEFSIGPLTFRVQYHYAGELDGLPAPVLAEPIAAALAAGAETESPDFQAVDDSVPFDPQSDPSAGPGLTTEAVLTGLVEPAKASQEQGKASPGAAPRKEKKSRLAPLVQGGAKKKPAQKPAAGPSDDPFDAFLNELG
jgi:predicted component of type VI protein secretion system